MTRAWVDASAWKRCDDYIHDYGYRKARKESTGTGLPTGTGYNYIHIVCKFYMDFSSSRVGLRRPPTGCPPTPPGHPPGRLARRLEIPVFNRPEETHLPFGILQATTLGHDLFGTSVIHPVARLVGHLTKYVGHDGWMYGTHPVVSVPISHREKAPSPNFYPRATGLPPLSRGLRQPGCRKVRARDITRHRRPHE